MLSKFTNTGRLLVHKIQRNYQKNVYQKGKRNSAEQMVKAKENRHRLLMKEKMEQAKENLKTNSPRIISTVIIAAQIPLYYLFYKILDSDYDQKQYPYLYKQYVDVQNIKNIIAGGTILGLSITKYVDFKVPKTSRVRTPARYPFYCLVPMMMAQFSISQNDGLHYAGVGSVIACNLSLVYIESLLTNSAIIPFWFFSMRFYISIFDMACLFYVMYQVRCFRNELDNNPSNYKHLLE